ncbi:PAS domain S-box protein [bacterium]|nr:PAS domain S-box protein [bacterium]
MKFFLSYLHFFAFLIYLYLAAFILVKSPKSSLKRVFLSLTICLALWSLGQIFLSHPHTSKEMAKLFGQIIFLGAISYGSFFLWFVLIFTKNERVLKTKIFYFIIFTLPLFFIYKQLTNFMIVDYSQGLYGYRLMWSTSIWPYFFYGYHFLLMGIGLYLLLIFERRTTNIIEKKQALVMVTVIIISLFIGSLTNFILPRLNLGIPEIENIFALIWVLGIIYVIVKYKFLVITPAMAADNIISTMSDGLILLDQKRNIVTINQAALNLLEYNKDELEGKKIEVIFPENLKDILLNKLNKLNSGGILENYEVILKSKLNKNIPVVFATSILKDKLGHIGGFACVLTDMTKHKQIEEALASEKELLAITLGSIDDGVIVTDIKGKIVLINGMALKLCGVTQKEALGQHLCQVFNIVDAYTQESYPDPVKKILQTGEIVRLGNNTMLISRDGKHRLLDDSGIVIHNKRGEVVGVVLVFRDITEKQQREEELKRTQRLETFYLFAESIAHDFNNILMAILSNVTLAKINLAPEDRIFKKLSEIEDISLKAKELTSQLFTLSKDSGLVKSLVSISELVKEVVKFNLSDSTIQAKISIVDDLHSIIGDSGQIMQVFNNLILNVKEAMPNGGEIEIKAKNITIEKEEKPIPLSRGDYIKVSIKDQGCGIPVEHLQKIFDPYFTTKDKGRGLGLSIVYLIIKRHGGYIEATSEVNKGTVFYLYLPASQEKEKIPKKKENKIIKGKGRVLLMDDEKEVLETTGELLKYLGYQVKLSRNGQEAIEAYKKAKESKKPFKVVLLDLTIVDGMGGKETIKELMKINPAVKAIVLSGYAENSVLYDHKNYGFKNFITKPYKIEELSQVLHQVITE